MTTVLTYQPFAGMQGGSIKKKEFTQPKKKRKPRRPPPVFPFVLQMYHKANGWKTIRKDGVLVLSKYDKKARNQELSSYLGDKSFLKQMKVQVFGRDSEDVSDLALFKMPIRWRRINQVSL